LRIDHAKELLRRTQLSVTEVALRVGYGSSQTLAREFRKEVGVSPTQYRCDNSADELTNRTMDTPT
jgi:AraC family transcriptional regulator